MSGCGENTRKFHLYLDSELPAAEALEFERHLMDCRDCQGRYQNLRSVADMVRGAKPLYDVPDSSLAGARALVANHERSRRWHWQLSAAAAVLIVAGAGVLGTVLAHHGASSGFPDFAVQAHDRYASSGMPLAVVSSRPEVVSGWLRQRLAFPLELPQYPAIPGQTKPYRLVGAGVLPFKGTQAAYIAYEMDRKPISLLMASTAEAASTGGSLYRSGGLLFRFYESSKLSIIAWTDHNIHYCLVSELGEGVRGAESCTICHGTAAEHRVIEELQPHRQQN